MAGEFYPQGVSPMMGAPTPLSNPLAMLMAQGGTNAAAQATHEANKMQYNLAREQNQMGYDLTKWQTNQANQQQWNLAQLEVDQRRANRDLQKYLAEQANAITRETNQMNYTLTGRSMDEGRDAQIRSIAAQDAQTLKMLDYLKTMFNATETAAASATTPEGKKAAAEAEAAITDEIKAKTEVHTKVIQPADQYMTQGIQEALANPDAAQSVNRFNQLYNSPVYPVGDKKYTLTQLASGEVPLSPEMKSFVNAQMNKARSSHKAIQDKWEKQFYYLRENGKDVYDVIKAIRPDADLSQWTDEDFQTFLDTLDPNTLPDHLKNSRFIATMRMGGGSVQGKPNRKTFAEFFWGTPASGLANAMTAEEYQKMKKAPVGKLPRAGKIAEYKEGGNRGYFSGELAAKLRAIEAFEKFKTFQPWKPSGPQAAQATVAGEPQAPATTWGFGLPQAGAGTTPKVSSSVPRKGAPGSPMTSDSQYPYSPAQTMPASQISPFETSLYGPTQVEKPLDVELFEFAYDNFTGSWDRGKVMEFLFSKDMEVRQRILDTYAGAPMGPMGEFLLSRETGSEYARSLWRRTMAASNGILPPPIPKDIPGEVGEAFDGPGTPGDIEAAGADTVFAPDSFYNANNYEEPKSALEQMLRGRVKSRVDERSKPVPFTPSPYTPLMQLPQGNMYSLR